MESHEAGHTAGKSYCSLPAASRRARRRKENLNYWRTAPFLTTRKSFCNGISRSRPHRRKKLLFSTSGEQAGAKAEGEFELLADGPILDDAEKFLQWNLTKPATPQEKAIVLYQRRAGGREGGRRI